MLTRFLDWLDEAAGGLIRVAYLLAGITAVAVYFGAGHLPLALDATLNAVLPWALAFALETHTYLTARRVRAAWQDHDQRALRVNLAVLVGLVAFSAWNQLGYLFGTWSPPTHTPLALPVWLAYLVRALVVPVAFLAAAFLAPLAEPIATQIENEARATLADVFKIARKQRRRMLTEAERAGRDMTGALVELVGDSELRRIISHAYAAIKAPTAPGTDRLVTSVVSTATVAVAPAVVTDPPGAHVAHPDAAVRLRDGAGGIARVDDATPMLGTPTRTDVLVDAPASPPDDEPTPPTSSQPPTHPARRGKVAGQAENNGHSRTTALGTLTPLRLPNDDGAEGFRPGAAMAVKSRGTRRGKRLTRAEVQASRKATRRAALAAQAVAILDEKPETTRESLRAILHCRQTTANELYVEWHYARSTSARLAHIPFPPHSSDEQVAEQ